MAKSGTPRHSKPARKPMTIEHDPVPKPKSDDAVKPNPRAHEAEPVGDFTQKPAEKSELSHSKLDTAKQNEGKKDASKPATAQSTASQPVSSTAAPSKASTVKDAGSVSQTHMQSEAQSQQKASAQTSNKSKSSTGANLVAGVAGGIIALAGAAALQWGNVIPSPGSVVTAEQLAHLEQEISALKVAPVSALLDQAGQQKLDQATNLAQAAANKLETFSNATTAKLGELQTQIDNQPAQASSDNSGDINALTAKIEALEKQLSATTSKANEVNAHISSDQNSITQLQDQFSALQEKVSEAARQPDMSVLIAANSLKNAIDRGGSYAAELETFKSVKPEDPAIEILTQHARTGIPAVTDFNAWFNPVADKIVATDNKAAPDASLWEHLMASAKSLVSVRPVGDVTGTGVGPTTARMESALHAGDLERALREWEQLPDDAKAVSQEFADQIKLRRDVDNLISRLVTESLQTKTETVTPQATQ
ncbi:COG4223 family protein [Brucellaceae bacterium C25G]